MPIDINLGGLLPRHLMERVFAPLEKLPNGAIHSFLGKGNNTELLRVEKLPNQLGFRLPEDPIGRARIDFGFYNSPELTYKDNAIVARLPNGKGRLERVYREYHYPGGQSETVPHFWEPKTHGKDLYSL